MEIRPIPKDVQSALRSASNLSTISHCVIELIYNAIDANALSIGVRIDLETFKIQVIDDGIGITKSNLEIIGKRYMSSKCCNLSDYTKNIKYYGFRGETLASLVKICQNVLIHTRPKNDSETYSKQFINGTSTGVLENNTARPKYGTTIDINGWMKNIPVRQKQVNEVCDLVDIKNQIEKISIIHPNISFSLRNNKNKKTIFMVKRRNSILSSINLFFGTGITDSFKYVNFEHKNYKITGYIGIKAIMRSDVQLIYLNRRYLRKSRIHKYLKIIFSDSRIVTDNENVYPMYFLNIECPYAEYDMISKSHNTNKIVFKNWHNILRYIEKVTIRLLNDENLMNCPKKPDSCSNLSENRSKIGISQFDTVIKGNVAKRVSSENHENYDKKTSRSETNSDKEISKKDNDSSVIVINKNIDYRNKLFENSDDSMKSKIIGPNKSKKSDQLRKPNTPFVKLSDNDIFKTPTAPALRAKSKVSKAVQYDLKDVVNRSNKNVSCLPNKMILSQNTVKTYNSHVNKQLDLLANCLENRTEKTRKDNQEYVENSFDETINPETKINNWLKLNSVGNHNETSPNIVIYFSNQKNERMKLPKSKNILKQINKTKPIKIGANIQRIDENHKHSNKNRGSTTNFHEKKEIIWGNRNNLENLRNQNMENTDYELIYQNLENQKNTPTEKQNNHRNLCKRKRLNQSSEFSINKNVKKMKIQNNVVRTISGEIEGNNTSVMSALTLYNEINKVSTKTKNNNNNIIGNMLNFSKMIKPDGKYINENNTEYIENTANRLTISERDIDYSVEIPIRMNESVIELQTPKPPLSINDFNKNTKKGISSSQRFEIKHTVKKFSFFTNNLIITTPINNTQIMELNTPEFTNTTVQENHHVWDLKVTPYPTDPMNLQNCSVLKDYSSHKIGTCVQDIIHKLETEHSVVSHQSQKDFDKPNNSPHLLERSTDNQMLQPSNQVMDIFNSVRSDKSYIMTKYFDQYAVENNINVLCEDKNYEKCDNSLSDLNLTEFERGIEHNDVITSTAKRDPTNEVHFELKNRLDIIPKGMSQILDDTSNVCICQHLSPRTKQELMKKIRKNYEDKLNFDHNTGLNELMFEKKFTITRNIQVALTKRSKIFRPHSFTKNIFNKLKIINQVDRKFIVAYLEPTFTENGVLILFDQHAVHERIRLEKLLKDYEKLPGILKATRLDENIVFNLDSRKKEIMTNFRSNFEKHGLIYEINDDCIHITSIPTCIFNKSVREKTSNRNMNHIATLTISLINEIIAFCLETKGVVTFIPQIVLTIVNSEACRGATKFGDALSKEDCELYIQQLSNCALPFQCAHGRPTLVPIFEVNKLNKLCDPIKVNFKSIINKFKIRD